MLHLFSLYYPFSFTPPKKNNKETLALADPSFCVKAMTSNLMLNLSGHTTMSKTADEYVANMICIDPVVPTVQRAFCITILLMEVPSPFYQHWWPLDFSRA